MSVLNPYHLARLEARFQAPIIVADLVARGQKLKKDEVLALHGLLSDMPPDTALIAIALCALRIVDGAETPDRPLAPLRLAADAILNDYGPLWLMSADDHPSLDLYESAIADRLEMIDEDFETLIDLLTLAGDLVGNGQPVCHSVLDILRVQAGAHRLLIHAAQEEHEASITRFSPPLDDGKIVPFPVRITRTNRRSGD